MNNLAHAFAFLMNTVNGVRFAVYKHWRPQGGNACLLKYYVPRDRINVQVESIGSATVENIQPR